MLGPRVAKPSVAFPFIDRTHFYLVHCYLWYWSHSQSPFLHAWEPGNETWQFQGAYIHVGWLTWQLTVRLCSLQYMMEILFSLPDFLSDYHGSVRPQEHAACNLLHSCTQVRARVESSQAMSGWSIVQYDQLLLRALKYCPPFSHVKSKLPSLGTTCVSVSWIVLISEE